MASSGVSTATVTRDEIIERALRVIGAIKPGEAPSADDLVTAEEALNVMLQAWTASPAGKMPWTEQMRSYSLSSVAEGTFTIGPGGDVEDIRPMRILGMELPDTETPLLPMTMREWMALEDKTTTGSTAYWVYDPQIPLGRVIVWPPPAQTVTVRWRQMRPVYDFTANTDTPDFPREWNSALVWSLAVELAPEYEVPASRLQVIAARAADYMKAAFGG